MNRPDVVSLFLRSRNVSKRINNYSLKNLQEKSQFIRTQTITSNTKSATMPTGMNQVHTQDWGTVNVGRASRPTAKVKTGVAKRYGTMALAICDLKRKD